MDERHRQPVATDLLKNALVMASIRVFYDTIFCEKTG